jgi:hypothetical protein
MTRRSLIADETLEAPAAAERPVASGVPQRVSKRAAKERERLTLDIGGATGRWKTPRAAATRAPAPTPMTNEMSTSVDGRELEVGEVIEAKGAAPGGGRSWFRAKVVALRSRYPPLHVRYTATLEGVTNRLALPEPVTAYLNADDVRRVA